MRWVDVTRRRGRGKDGEGLIMGKNVDDGKSSEDLCLPLENGKCELPRYLDTQGLPEARAK